MEWLNSIIERSLDLMKWWVTVVPWERALRVRAGKNVIELGPGIHLRIPMLDRMFTQSVRLRTVDVMAQTVSTLDGHSLTVAGVVQFKVINLAKLYDTLHQPEDTLADMSGAFTAEYVSSRVKSEVTVAGLAEFVKEKLDLNKYGLGRGDYAVTDFAYAKTYRLLQQQRFRNMTSFIETESYD